LGQLRNVRVQGARKGTPFAAQLAAKEVATKARDLGVKYVDVKIKGPGAGRESAIRSLQSVGLEIKSIKDVTPIPTTAAGCKGAAGSERTPEEGDKDVKIR